MTDREKAKIILESLDEKITINWNLENYYLDAIVKGLCEIKKSQKIIEQ